MIEHPETITVDAFTRDLIEMADMYVNKCTRQEEKFDYARRQGITWTWAECEAAYALLVEQHTPYGEWRMVDAWRRGRLQVTT